MSHHEQTNKQENCSAVRASMHLKKITAYIHVSNTNRAGPIMHYSYLMLE